MTETKLVQLTRHINQSVPRPLAKWLCRPLESMLAIDEVNRWYADLVNCDTWDAAFSKILTLRDISYLITADDLAKIPVSGPLVVVANHPFGCLEGIVLGDLFERVRPDTKILGNYLLEKIEPNRDSIIPVDPFDRKSSVSSNANTFRNCLKWLKAGNCLVTFPAGDVSHYCHRQRRITDLTWSTHVAALVRMSGAQALPVYFPGRSSLLFNLSGLIHPRLRTIMLGRELAARRASRARLFVGRPIAPKQMRPYDRDESLIRWLRSKTYFLASRTVINDPPETFLKKRSSKETMFHALIEPVPRMLLAAEVNSLPEDNCLVRHKQIAVYVTEREPIPHLLREIGRLREQTFREVGEGTGKSMDIDLFDSTYRHLILWNSEANEVVGAYRMGDTADILRRFGRKGLYTHSLFRFKPGLLNYLENSLELERSFIQSKYQGQPNCLALLWNGIGAYLVRHPEYRILFGPVSISNSYHRVSKNLMVQFLQRRCSLKELAACVSPRRPFRPSTDRHMA